MKRSGDESHARSIGLLARTTNNDDGVDNDYNGTDYNEYSDYSDHNDDEERGLTQQQPAPPAGTGRCTTGAPRPIAPNHTQQPGGRHAKSFV